MLKLSTKVALAALISISALSTADASKGTYEESFVQEANSIQYRTNRSGLVRSQPIKPARILNPKDFEDFLEFEHNFHLLPEFEEVEDTGIVQRAYNYITSFFWRS